MPISPLAPTRTPPAQTGAYLIFRRDPAGAQLLASLTGQQAAAALTAALAANTELDESFTCQFQTVDDLASVRETCAAVGIDIPTEVVDALAAGQPWMRLRACEIRAAAQLIAPAAGPCQIARDPRDKTLTLSQAGQTIALSASTHATPDDQPAGSTALLDVTPSQLIECARLLDWASAPGLVIIGHRDVPTPGPDRVSQHAA